MSQFDPTLIETIAKQHYTKVWSALKDYDDHEDPKSAWAHLPEIFVASLETGDTEFIKKIIKRLHKMVYFDKIDILVPPIEQRAWPPEIKAVYKAQRRDTIQSLNGDIYHCAILNGTPTQLLNIIAQGASINCFNNGGTTLAMAALDHNNLEVFKALLEYVAPIGEKPQTLNVNAKDYENTYLIEYAAHAYIKNKKLKPQDITGFEILLNYFKHNSPQLELFESQLRPKVKENAAIKECLEKAFLNASLPKSQEEVISPQKLIHKI